MRNNAAERCIKCGMRNVGLVAIYPAADYVRNEVSARQLSGSHFLILYLSEISSTSKNRPIY